MNYREDQMKIRNRQQLALAGLNPFDLRQKLTLRAMSIIARVIRVLPMLTGVTFQFMAAKDRGPAIYNIGDDFGLAFRKRFKPRTKLPKNIGDLEPWSGNQSRLRFSFVHWL